jgi:heme exporter protein A
MALLKARSLAHFYGPRLIFKDLSLELRPGAIIMLAGANGAGKSTLLKILAGLIRPSAGEVEMGSGSEGKALTIGYLGHQTFIYPELTALENLRFWAKLYDIPLTETACEAVLERVELAAFAGEKARGFSRGMAQRLNLARIFLLESDILLLDEPGTGLDTHSTAILHRELVTARYKGAGIIWITHSLDDDLQRADTVAFLGKKSLDFYGPATAFRSWADGCPAPASSRQTDGGALC